MLIAEDFQLTKPEFYDLIYYMSKFETFFPQGGKGKSFSRVCATVCIILLERDKRPIYQKNEKLFNKKYNLFYTDFPKMYRWAKDEIWRINDATIPYLRKFFSEVTPQT